MSNKDEINSSDEVTTGKIPSELLTKKELAQRVKISQRKIELDKDLPKIKWGRTVRYDWAAVLNYLHTQ
ncbi:hypothetical protein N8491_01360 [Akkermansiaceae bacterium]|nr:hypothetical protein [Akkermansiaceae bacterium]MDA7656835.1 hypothetical protein [bacterium]MDA7498421.1 hypothetical protein [Akkermansiaceae bacterium]MDA7626215.1 hypothetical protein [Akkermansiaceae bacterium]MDA7656640.1 hypothetical protein [Akkermansiaceae bacterium]